MRTLGWIAIGGMGGSGPGGDGSVVIQNRVGFQWVGAEHDLFHGPQYLQWVAPGIDPSQVSAGLLAFGPTRIAGTEVAQAPVNAAMLRQLLEREGLPVTPAPAAA